MDPAASIAAQPARPEHPERPERERRYPWRRLTAAAGLAIALGALFYPMLGSGLARIPGDLGDGRLCNFLLEHTFLWAAGRPDHASFWNPPVLYPQPNALARTENMLGAAPLYWLWRAVRLAPDTAFQMWLLTVAALDYLAARLFLRRCLGTTGLAADLGAILFCADAARARSVGHAQLMPQFYSLAALAALASLVPGDDPPPRRPWLDCLGWLAAAAAIVLQLWTSFYLGWFLVLGLASMLLWGLAFPASRPIVLTVARRDWRWAALAAAAAAAATWPLAAHSRMVVELNGWPRLADALAMLPRGISWLSMGVGSRWFQGTRFAQQVATGLGWVTLALALAGLWLARRRPWALPALATCLTLALLVSRTAGGASLWTAILWIPGARAIRAVARVGLLLLVPAIAGVALAIDRLRVKRPLIAAVLAAACILEQAYNPPTYLKSVARQRAADTAALIPASCPAFRLMAVEQTASKTSNLVSIYTDNDALFAQLATAKPTANFYGVAAALPAAGAAAYAAAFPAELARQGLHAGDECLVFVPASE